MDRFEYVNELMSFYVSLLTERQQEILKNYYYEDLSLSEIAENLSISRNGVHDALNKSVKAMENYEEKLHLRQKYQQRMKLYAELNKLNNAQIDDVVEELIKQED